MAEKYALGALAPKKDIREFKAVCVSGAEATEFPEEFELNIPLTVKNQGNINSCVAHGISTVIEYFNKLQEGTDVVYSTGYLYGNRRGSSWNGEGMFMDDALSNAVKFGDVPNGLFNVNVEVPEAITKFEEKAFELSPEALPNRFSEFFSLGSDAQRKLNLMQNGPILFSMEWFDGYYVDKANHYILTKPKNAQSVGYHCMVIYGWDKWGWKFQNSWGLTWGNRGRAVLPYGSKFATCYGIKDEISDKLRNQRAEQLEIQIKELNAALTQKDKEFHEMSLALAEYQKQLEERNKEVDYTRSLVAETRVKIEMTKENKKETYNYISELEDRVNQLKSDVENYKNSIADIERELEEKRAEEKSLVDSGAPEFDILAVRDRITVLEGRREEFLNTITTLNNEINDTTSLLFTKRTEVSNMEIEISKLEAALHNYELDYEEAFKKLGELSALNIELNNKYQDALKSIQDYTKQLEEQQQEIEILKEKVLDVEKPYQNMPKFLAHFINWLINLFSKKE